MTTFVDHVAGLRKLASFDPRIFVEDSIYPQEFCDFMLALALAYNDYRDVFVAQLLLWEVQPGDLKRPTPSVGEFAGINCHLMRTLAGILRELLIVIEKNHEVVASKEFGKLV